MSIILNTTKVIDIKYRTRSKAEFDAQVFLVIIDNKVKDVLKSLTFTNQED